MYEKMYHQLFNAITDALLAMEEENYGIAKKRLRQGQRDSEETYIRWEDAENEVEEQKK